MLSSALDSKYKWKEKEPKTSAGAASLYGWTNESFKFFCWNWRVYSSGLFSYLNLLFIYLYIYRFDLIRVLVFLDRGRCGLSFLREWEGKQQCAAFISFFSVIVFFSTAFITCPKSPAWTLKSNPFSIYKYKLHNDFQLFKILLLPV